MTYPTFFLAARSTSLRIDQHTLQQLRSADADPRVVALEFPRRKGVIRLHRRGDVVEVVS